MKTLDKGKDKIKEICQALRAETIEPAKQEAERLIQAAQEEREQILAAAKLEAEAIIEETHKKAQQQKRVLEASLSQGCKQAVGALREEVEKKLFNAELNQLVQGGTSGPMLIAKLITAVVQGIEKMGISADLSALIPEAVSAQEVNDVLSDGICKKLRGGSVELGSFSGGAKVRMNDKNLTIDISDKALQSLLAEYVRKDFRAKIFGA